MKSRALSRKGFHRNQSFVAVHDRMDDAEAQPHAPIRPHGFGGEVGIENVGQMLGGDARPRVPQGDPHVPARGQPRLFRPVHGNRLGPETERAAAFRHGLPGVFHHLKNGHPKLPLVRRHHGQPRRNLQLGVQRQPLAGFVRQLSQQAR